MTPARPFSPPVQFTKNSVGKLDISRMLIWLAIVMNGLFFIDPSDSNFGLIFQAAYVPYFLLGMAFLSVWAGSPFDFCRFRFSKIDVMIFCYLAIPIIGGFAFSTVQNGDNFARLGAFGVVYFMSKSIFKTKSYAAFFAKMVQPVLFWMSMSIIIMLFAWRIGLLTSINQANQNLFHEEIFILVCLPFLTISSLGRQRALLFLAVIGCLLTGKNTGFILAVFIVSTYVFATSTGVAKLAKLSLFVFVIFTTAAMSVYFFGDILPDGNVDTRLTAYGFRIAQFSNSVLIGNLFFMSSQIDVGWGLIASHSDVLDILAGAGVFGLFLFSVPMFALIFSRSKSINENLCLAKVIMAGFLLVSCLNPVLMTPKLAFIFWLSAGYLSARISQSQQEVF